MKSFLIVSVTLTSMLLAGCVTGAFDSNVREEAIAPSARIMIPAASRIEVTLAHGVWCGNAEIPTPITMHSSGLLMGPSAQKIKLLPFSIQGRCVGVYTNEDGSPSRGRARITAEYISWNDDDRGVGRMRIEAYAIDPADKMIDVRGIYEKHRDAVRLEPGSTLTVFFTKEAVYADATTSAKAVNRP